MITKELHIKTQTSGFASPAESYVDKRLDINELIIDNVYSTFFFRYMGPTTLGVENGSVLVLDKSVKPQVGDLVVLSDKTFFKIREYNGQENLWGKVTWILTKK